MSDSPSAPLLVGGRLQRAGTWVAGTAAFAIQRAEAERAAARTPGRAPTLADVYATMAASPFLLDPDLAMAVEQATQHDLGQVRSHHGPEAAPTRYEATLERHAMATGGVSSLLADASRAVRSPEGGARQAVAAGVAAPTLVGFVAWTLAAARTAGCDRVGYVSRDGQILQAIAARLESCRPPEEQLRVVYTHGGRRVWHPAGLTPALLAGDPPGWWVGEGMPAGQPASPLDMLALDERDVPPTVAATVREILAGAPADRGRRLGALWADPEVRRALVEVGRARRRLLCGHLTQSGLGTGRWAMVDVGWRGRSAASLNRALQAEGLSTPLHLYFGLIKPDAELTETGDWAPYLFCRPGPDREAGDLGGGLPSFIEVVCSADHGPARGFREGPDGIEPVLDPVDADALEWGIGAVQATVLEVAERMAPFAQDLASADLRPALKELLRQFLHAPDPAELAAWRSFPFAPDPSGAGARAWVAEWSLADALRWATRGDRPHSFWPQASRTLLPAAGRSMIGAREALATWVSRRRSSGSR